MNLTQEKFAARLERTRLAVTFIENAKSHPLPKTIEKFLALEKKLK